MTVRLTVWPLRRYPDGAGHGPALRRSPAYVNFFQPSFKLKEKRREGAKVIKRYHDPATPFARALAHPKVTRAVKVRLRDMHHTLDPVARDAGRPDRARRTHRSSSWQDGRAAGSITCNRCRDLCQDARQVWRGGRATRHAPAAETSPSVSTSSALLPGAVDGAACDGNSAPLTAPPVDRQGAINPAPPYPPRPGNIAW
jgi:hypothetical protein